MITAGQNHAMAAVLAAGLRVSTQRPSGVGHARGSKFGIRASGPGVQTPVFSDPDPDAVPLRSRAYGLPPKSVLW